MGSAVYASHAARRRSASQAGAHAARVVTASGPIAPGVWSWVAIRPAQASSDRPFHLHREQAVQLDGVLHRQLLDEGLEEAVDDERCRIRLAQST